MNQIFIFCLLVVLLTPTVFAQNAQGPTGVTITNETDVEIRFSLQADHGRLMPFIIQSHSSKKYNCNPTCRDFYFEMNTNIKTVDIDYQMMVVNMPFNGMVVMGTGTYMD